VLNLDWELADVLWLAITQIEAQQTLLEMRLMDHPNSKQSARESWHREMHRLAYPKSWSVSKDSANTEDVAKQLRTMLNG
jgi:hypothetical protein